MSKFGDLGSRKSRRVRALIQSTIFFACVLAFWEVATRLMAIPEIVLPAPSAIGAALFKSVISPNFLFHLGITMWEVAAGFVVGATIGIASGILIGASPRAEQLLYPYIVAFQALPKVSVAPIIMIWFGYGLTSKIVLTATMSFFPLLANTIAGMRATPPEYRDLFFGITANRWQTFWKLNLPLALPFIFVGLDLSLLLSVTGAIVGEFVGSRAGLGFLILQRNFALDMAGNFAILVILAMIGLLLHFIVKALEKKVLFWR